ncbi:hypothetical protein PanWU01x14_093830, partial [Parasponia andersonii]
MHYIPAPAYYSLRLLVVKIKELALHPSSVSMKEFDVLPSDTIVLIALSGFNFLSSLFNVKNCTIR